MTPTEQQAYDTIIAQNKWIEEAKPLLARGGLMERDNAALRARCERLEGERDKRAGWINGHCDDMFGDHACVQCWPGDPLNITGFQCAVHLAKALAQPEDGK